MSVDELDANEMLAFLEWRRNLASLEENETLVLTPVEKNICIWKQVWKLLEVSHLLVMVVDARDPLFYRCPDLEVYAKEIDEHKRTMLLVNKADLLPPSIRKKWAEYFKARDILHVFWSAKAATATLEGKKMGGCSEEESVSLDLDTKIYGREELLMRLQAEAESVVAQRRTSTSEEDRDVSSSDSVSLMGNRVVVGFIGYPNVGKSSTINALFGEERTDLTHTPGKTKHFQALIISEELILCDCPSLVFPSFSSSRHELVACGVLPIDRMTKHREAIQVVADRVPRSVLEQIYKITLPKPKPYESQCRPPTAAELLRACCASWGHVSHAGLPDETRASRQILKDYIDGKIPHFELPPGVADAETEHEVVNGSEGPTTSAANPVPIVESSSVPTSISFSTTLSPSPPLLPTPGSLLQPPTMAVAWDDLRAESATLSAHVPQKINSLRSGYSKRVSAVPEGHQSVQDVKDFVRMIKDTNTTRENKINAICQIGYAAEFGGHSFEPFAADAMLALYSIIENSHRRSNTPDDVEKHALESIQRIINTHIDSLRVCKDLKGNKWDVFKTNKFCTICVRRLGDGKIDWTSPDLREEFFLETGRFFLPKTLKNRWHKLYQLYKFWIEVQREPRDEKWWFENTKNKTLEFRLLEQGPPDFIDKLIMMFGEENIFNEEDEGVEKIEVESISELQDKVIKLECMKQELEEENKKLLHNANELEEVIAGKIRYLEEREEEKIMLLDILKTLIQGRSRSSESSFQACLALGKQLTCPPPATLS